MRLVNLSPPYSTLRPPLKLWGAKFGGEAGNHQETQKSEETVYHLGTVRRIRLHYFACIGNLSASSFLQPVPPFSSVLANPFSSLLFLREKKAPSHIRGGGAAQQRPLKIPSSWAASLYFGKASSLQSLSDKGIFFSNPFPCSCLLSDTPDKVEE